MSKSKLTHVLESQQFSREFLEKELFPLAKEMEQIQAQGGDKSLRGKRTYNLFYEPSTRTRVSFETAITYLGGTCKSTENAAQFSSAVKGETLEDTIRILEGYGYDVIILRHKEEGAAAKAAKAVKKAAIINAGDGTGQHPTQALLDLYTVYKSFKRIDGLKFVIVGDLRHGRTANSLIYLAAKFKDVSFTFVAPRGFGVQPGIKTYLKRHQIPFDEKLKLNEGLGNADVVYMTRPQLERHQEGKKFQIESFTLNPEALSLLKKEAIVMHPLPRNSELPPEVDSDPRVVIFEQAQNGLYIRMALFRMILS